jgi:hypothetical protein
MAIKLVAISFNSSGSICSFWNLFTVFKGEKELIVKHFKFKNFKKIKGSEPEPQRDIGSGSKEIL